MTAGSFVQRYDVLVDDPTDPFLTVGDIAQQLGVVPATVRAYASRAQMPPPDMRYGNKPLWKTSTITTWRRLRKVA